MHALEELGLNETLITDAGLRHLENLPSLALLHVKNTAVTEEGAARLRVAELALGDYRVSVARSPETFASLRAAIRTLASAATVLDPLGTAANRAAPCT